MSRRFAPASASGSPPWVAFPVLVVGLLACGALTACGDDTDDDNAGGDTSADVSADAGDGSATPDAEPDDDTDAGETDTPDAETDGSSPIPDGPLFSDGCPVPGAARAWRIENPETRMEGPNALGGQGDWMLMNEHAAFIIQDTDNVKTYWYYGGAPIDAVAIDGCSQAGPEQYDEMGFLIGLPNVGTFTDSTLRGFRGDSVELISDGSDGGEARIRVTGADDYFWLIELELVKRGFIGGDFRSLSEPMGIEVTVDYVLRPDSPVLAMELTVTNTLTTRNPIIVGMVQFFADGTRTFYHNDDRLAVAGFGADVGIPWLANTSGTGAWVFGIENWSLASTNISGVDALIDVNTFLNPTSLAAAGTEGDSFTTRMFFSVGGSDGASGVTPLAEVLTEPVVGLPVALQPVAGRVVDSTGAGVAGVRVPVEVVGSNGLYSPITEFITAADGTFTGQVPALGANTGYRLRALLDGRPEPEPLNFAPGATDLEVSLAPGGTFTFTVQEGEGGVPLPAKVVLWQNDRIARVFWTDGTEQSRLVVPGTYEVDVTRGFEYGVFRETITIAPGEATVLPVTMERLLDTSGYLSMDGHVHAGPSPDSAVLVPDRILSLAAEGVEIAVSTDHEILRDWRPGLEETGLTDWVNTVLGEEVTPPLPEHTNAYPFVPDPNDVRGNPPDWRGLDIAELHQTIRDRGAQIVALNHPRLGCGYMCLAGYDRLLGDVTLEDPTQLGFEPDAQLWSWNFDSIEYQNGNREVFLNPESPSNSGLFEDWMSFLNHGHGITATGVTDTHGADAEGSPRNFFVAPTDSPAEFTEDMLVTAIREGRSLVSTGAFAHVVANGTATLGDTLTAADGVVELAVRIEAIPEIDVTHFTVFANCDEVGTWETTDPGAVVKFDGTVTLNLEADAHVVVLGFGQELLPRNLPQFDPDRIPRFTTNPIFVDVDGNTTWEFPGGKTCEYDLEPERKTRLDTIPRSHHLLTHLDAWLWWRTSLIPEALQGQGPCLCGTHDEHH